jgi:hypothetical protein
MAVFQSLSPGMLALITLLVLVGIMAYSAETLKPQLENPTFITEEGKLAKLTALQIVPGESYTYAYSVGNESINLTYMVMGGNDCTVISLSQSSASVCLDSSANDASGQNSSYSVPAIIMIKPWMLAVDEGWKWNVSSHLVFDDFKKHITDTGYATVRKEYYKGREAYVVRVSSSEGDLVWDWIDSEKRILLREMGPGYEVELIEGLPLSRNP